MSTPSPPGPEPQHKWGLSTIAVVIFLFVGSGMLLAIPGMIGVAVLLGGLLFFGMLAFHYFVWGRWLGEMLRREAEEEGDSQG